MYDKLGVVIHRLVGVKMENLSVTPMEFFSQSVKQKVSEQGGGS